MTSLAIGPDELESIATDIWATYVSEESVVIPSSLALAPFGGEINAHVRITGGALGVVIVSCDRTSADDLTRRLFQLPAADVPDQDDVVDAIGEMANVLGGNVKSLSLAPAVLTLPQIAERDDGSSGEPLCEVEVIWDGGRATLSVWSAINEHTTTAMEASQ